MVHWIYWVCVVLTGMLIIPNMIYAVRYFLYTRRRAWFLTFSAFLFFLGFFLFRLSYRTIEFIQIAKETMMMRDS